MTSSLVIGGRVLALPGALGMVLQAAQQRRAQTGFVGAAVRCRHGVAIGRHEAVGIGGPGHRPFDRALGAGLAASAGEDIRHHQRPAFDLARDEILQAIGEMERRFGWHVDAGDQLLVAIPADFDAAEQICLGARHLEHALRIELRLGAEDFRVGLEADSGAAAVVDLAELLEVALRLAAHERLACRAGLAARLRLRVSPIAR